MKRSFGTLPDGTATHLLTLDSRTGLRAEILDYGGILRGLSFPGRHGRTSLVLGFSDLDAYVRDHAYVGTIIGRYANRIAGAQFTLDGKIWQLTANEGPNHLHGGQRGLGKRVWRILDWQDGTQPRVRLGYRSPDGEEGYPGNLDISAEFALRDDELIVSFEAGCDAATPINLTYHPYFNLVGDPAAPLAAHWLKVPADKFLAISDGALIPSGEIASVQDTPLDFRRGRALATSAAESSMQLAHAGGYDHCLLLADEAQYSAELYSEHSGIRMHVSSNMPAIQVYGGHWLARQYPHRANGFAWSLKSIPMRRTSRAFQMQFSGLVNGCSEAFATASPGTRDPEAGFHQQPQDVIRRR